MGQTPGASTYLLGHADPEVQRLLLQAHLYDEDTEHGLLVAGIKPGMRVLDVGCGPGDVSFLAARLVGTAGAVIGIDAAREVIELARNRATEAGLSTVSFRQSTIADLVLDEPVDAVIGRLILMHLPDPMATLRQLAGFLRPGGVIAFCETDIIAARSIPDLPLFRALTAAIVSAFRAADLDPAFGTTLYELFQRAGMGAPRLTLGAPVGGAENADLPAYGIATWRLMFPVAEAAGLVTEELADPDMLLARMREELAATRGLVIGPQLITASARTPTEL
jgi:2-polyprenyl-3-methyl-5-hydroxy-6-metoxy-1,4-benzoquinol methylase